MLVERKMEMFNKFKKWCETERVGRVEEGTSQDVFPTNGDELIINCILIVVGLAIVGLILFRCVS